METEIIKSDKNDFELKLDDLTVAELLRVYLNKIQGVDFVALKNDNISKSSLLKVNTSGKNSKKAFGEAIALIRKDSEKLLKVLKNK